MGDLPLRPHQPDPADGARPEGPQPVGRRLAQGVGGGVVFGPKPRDFSKKISKKTKALALRKPCLSHRWDLSRLACVACGARIYVEVRIS